LLIHIFLSLAVVTKDRQKTIFVFVNENPHCFLVKRSSVLSCQLTSLLQLHGR